MRSYSSQSGSVLQAARLGQSAFPSVRQATGEREPSISSSTSPIGYSYGLRHSLYPPPLPLAP